jgi:diguanylate cyclase (GGDEF)-like protein
MGINRFNTKTKKFTNYSTKHGLANNVVYKIEEDNQGFIWLSTNQGLSRMDPKTETFKNYDVGDGLQSNEFNFGASFKSKTGELFFGGINGLNRFFPENITDDIQIPKVIIVNMLLANKSVAITPIGEQAINNQTESAVTQNSTAFSLKQAIHHTKSIILTYRDNIIALEFSTLHFTNARKNQFAYQLVGWDENWVHTDYKNRRATYTNLPHGDYTFKVKASNADGYWNEEGTSLKITVLPPPWKTWWAYTLYGLFLLSLVWAFIRSQQKKVLLARQLNAQLESKVVARTVELQSSNENLAAVNNQLEKVNTQLEEISLTDQLTGLRNRHFLVHNLQNDINLILRQYTNIKSLNITERRNGSDLIFFLIDLDHFKQVNDVYGHSAGDAVLIQIKEILASVFRETDYLVRWGGEEFLVIARFTDRNNASVLAERLRDGVEQHSFDIGQGNAISKTCSIGYASYPFLLEQPECLDWERVVDIADHCLYAAKKSNRNTWVGLSNIDCSEKDLFSNITEKTEHLIDIKQLSVESSITNTSLLKWG